MSDRPDYYRLPPIIERVASIYVPMDEERFATRLPSWQELVSEYYPVEESIQQWVVKAEEKDGVPIFDTLHPVLQIIPRFSRKTSAEGFDWSIRCPRKQFTMNMHSEPGHGELRRYKHLREEFAVWLPLWLTHFDVKEALRIEMIYVNVLTQKTVPAFFDEDGLFIARVISVFSEIPGDHVSILPPYKCEVTLGLQGDPGSTLAIKLNDTVHRYGAGLQLSLVATLPWPDGQTVDGETVLPLLDRAHGHIVSHFESIFTPEAKASFEPVTE